MDPNTIHALKNHVRRLSEEFPSNSPQHLMARSVAVEELFKPFEADISALGLDWPPDPAGEDCLMGEMDHALQIIEYGNAALFLLESALPANPLAASFSEAAKPERKPAPAPVAKPTAPAKPVTWTQRAKAARASQDVADEERERNTKAIASDKGLTLTQRALKIRNLK